MKKDVGPVLRGGGSAMTCVVTGQFAGSARARSMDVHTSNLCFLPKGAVVAGFVFLIANCGTPVSCLIDLPIICRSFRRMWVRRTIAEPNF